MTLVSKPATTFTLGHAEAVSRRTLTAEGRDRRQVSPCGI
jgi:hypothetical protein